MEENKQFDFEKHYGDEQQAPPSFFWNDLEAELPQPKKKRIGWVGSTAIVIVLALLIAAGVEYYSKPQKSITFNNKITLPPAPKKSGIPFISPPLKKDIPPPSSTSNLSTSKPSNPNRIPPVSNTKRGSNSQSVGLTNNTHKTQTKEQEIHTSLLSEDASNAENETEKETEHTLELIEEKTTETNATDTTIENKKENQLIVPDKQQPKGIFISYGRIIHTHSFQNFSSGYSLGVGFKKQLTPRFSSNFSVNYVRINNPDISRTSQQEHYFLEKTTTTQELAINSLNYFSNKLQVQYNIGQNTAINAGVETWWLLRTDAQLSVVEQSQSDEQIVRATRVEENIKGINRFVPVLSVGVTQNITRQLEAELNFNRSVSTFGSVRGISGTENLNINYMVIKLNVKF